MVKPGDRYIIEIEDSCENMLFRVKGIPHVLLTKYDLEGLTRVKRFPGFLGFLFHSCKNRIAHKNNKRKEREK